MTAIQLESIYRMVVTVAATAIVCATLTLAMDHPDVRERCLSIASTLAVGLVIPGRSRMTRQ